MSASHTQPKKLVLITGANKGIGYEAARQLSVKGFEILLGARDIQRGEAAAKKLREEGVNATFLHLDVTNDSNVAKAVSEVDTKYGHLDVLVNNAGVVVESWGTKASQLSLQSLQETLSTNLDGVIRVTQHFLPLLKKASKARIINVSSSYGSKYLLSNAIDNVIPAYHISKAALNMWTVLLAKELKADSIAVNSVCPGWVQTDMGGSQAPRTVDQGAAIIIKLATQEDEVTGGYFDDAGVIAW